MVKKTAIAKMTGRAWLSLFLLMMIFPVSAIAVARIGVAPYLDYDYSSNIFWDSSAVGDAIFSPGVELNIAAGQFILFLNADGKVYQSNDYLNRSAISGGFNLITMLSKRSSFFLSPDFSLTRFKGGMSYLNTAIPSLVMGLKHVFSDQVYGRMGVSLRHSDYLEEDSYDRWRGSAFGEISVFFKTQTTLRLSLGMNYLFFPHITDETDATTATTGAKPATMAVTTAGGRRRYAPVPSDPQPTQIPGHTVSLDFPQPYIVFRAAQGLGYKTGLIAEVQYRQNPDIMKRFDPLTIDEWALQGLDEDFFWQGTRLSLALKTEAVLKLEMAVDFSYSAKEYDGLNALDMNNDPIAPQAFRTDRLSQITMRIAKSLGSFSLNFTASYRKNASNDLYFDYDFYTISAGIDYAF